jgi:predicted PurR-regulated permease PerM
LLRRFCETGTPAQGERGEQSVHLAAKAIRGVALGVAVTAFIQSAVGTIGLTIAAVPFGPMSRTFNE